MELPILGPVVLDPEKHSDDRGFFARSFDREEFVAAGLEPVVEQTNIAFSDRTGTVRGLHYQIAPALEAKLVRCTRGAIFDVAVDLRPGSPTYLSHVSVELTHENGLAIYVPPLFAHGYQTLEDSSEVTYQVSARYAPAAERGLRHDDPALEIEWPMEVSNLSDKDNLWPLVADGALG